MTPLITTATRPADVRALTLRQPWAWCVTDAGKDVENRTWNPSWRGPLLIHSAARCSALQYCEADRQLRGIGVDIPGLDELSGQPDRWDKSDRWVKSRLPLGAIVAVAELADVILPGGYSGVQRGPRPDRHPLADSRWYQGRYGLVLSRVQLLRRPVPCRGLQRMWCPGPALLERVREQLS